MSDMMNSTYEQEHSRRHREIFVVRNLAELGRERYDFHHKKLNLHSWERTQQQLNWTAWAEWIELLSQLDSVEMLLVEWRMV